MKKLTKRQAMAILAMPELRDNKWSCYTEKFTGQFYSRVETYSHDGALILRLCYSFPKVHVYDMRGSESKQ